MRCKKRTHTFKLHITFLIITIWNTLFTSGLLNYQCFSHESCDKIRNRSNLRGSKASFPLLSRNSQKRLSNTWSSCSLTSNKMKAPLLILKMGPQPRSREPFFKATVFILTFLIYMSMHSARKCISVVKNAEAFLDCEAHLNVSSITEEEEKCSSWFTEMDGKHEAEAKTWLGFIDTSFLVSYSVFMFCSGVVAERMNLRYFLVIGLMMSSIYDSGCQNGVMCGFS